MWNSVTFTKGILLTEVSINQIKTAQSCGILKVVHQNKQASAKFQSQGIYSLIWSSVSEKDTALIQFIFFPIKM